MRADRERMKTLLVEAIATLCRNGLHYDMELSVEGLIGITLDKQEVFLVSVRETFNLPGHLDKTQDDFSKPSSDGRLLSSDSSPSVEIEPGERLPTPRRPPKRTLQMLRKDGDGPTVEKHKRKGEPKQIPLEEVDLINSSPQHRDATSPNYDNSSLDAGPGSPMHPADRIGTGGTMPGTGTYEPFDNNETNDEAGPRHGKRKKDVIVIDLDVPVKEEVKDEDSHLPCRFVRTDHLGAASDPGDISERLALPSLSENQPLSRTAFHENSTLARPPPPLQPRPFHISGSAAENDPSVSLHTSNSQEQLALSTSQETALNAKSDDSLSLQHNSDLIDTKEETHGDTSMSGFSLSGELVRVPGSLAKSPTSMPVPVNVLPVQTMSSAAPSSSSLHGAAGSLGDFSGLPVDWPGTSTATNQEFIPMPANLDDQSQGTPGSTQQMCEDLLKYVKNLNTTVETAEGRKFKCPLCDAVYGHKHVMQRHVLAKHVGAKFCCHICFKMYDRKDCLAEHIKRLHFTHPASPGYPTHKNWQAGT